MPVVNLFDITRLQAYVSIIGLVWRKFMELETDKETTK